MILEYLDDHGRPVKVIASRIVIRDAVHNTPVLVAADFARAIMAAKAGDADFDKLLQVVGVTQTVFTTQMTQDDLILPGIR